MIALVVGILLLLPALGLVAGGGVMLWADRVGRDGNGYVFSSSEHVSSPGSAITSASIDVSTGANWVPLSATLGNARLEITGTGSSSDVFVGVARVSDADAYLRGVQRTVIADLGNGSAASHETLVAGGAPSGPPGEQNFWTASVSGSGTQRLSWVPSGGNWTLVVMNADGSPGVSVDARLGATVPALGGLAWGLLVAGVVLALIAVLAIVLAARSRPVPPHSYDAPHAPPSWTPPVPVDRTTAADAARSEIPQVPPPS